VVKYPPHAWQRLTSSRTGKPPPASTSGNETATYLHLNPFTLSTFGDVHPKLDEALRNNSLSVRPGAKTPCRQLSELAPTVSIACKRHIGRWYTFDDSGSLLVLVVWTRMKSLISK
jgi:hypothetical protein